MKLDITSNLDKDYHEVIEVKPSDAAGARIDRVVQLPEGDLGVIEGKTTNGVAEPPKIPRGAYPICQIHVRNGVTYIDNGDILMAGTTGDQDQLVTLNPEDPFESLLIPMIEMNRRKRADYASDDDIYRNFRINAAMMALPGYTPAQDALSMITRKVGRITNLRGRPPTNESVLDSWLDLAVYAVLGYGLAKEEAEYYARRKTDRRTQ
jgi:hypothetical protein